MLLLFSARRTAIRRGFTLSELLVAMALITLLMSILSQAFVEGLGTFRHLKGIGDMSEQLRAACFQLRTDVLTSGVAANEFIDDTFRTGSPDTSAAGNLRVRYEAICADALDLKCRLLEVQRDTTNPVARRLMAWILDALDSIKLGAATIVEILDLIAPRGTGG
jgi:prepilin-type N-terminal cleavage/methylation domain-containing protein